MDCLWLWRDVWVCGASVRCQSWNQWHLNLTLPSSNAAARAHCVCSHGCIVYNVVSKRQTFRSTATCSGLWSIPNTNIWQSIMRATNTAGTDQNNCWYSNSLNLSHYSKGLQAFYHLSHPIHIAMTCLAVGFSHNLREACLEQDSGVWILWMGQILHHLGWLKPYNRINHLFFFRPQYVAVNNSYMLNIYYVMYHEVCNEETYLYTMNKPPRITA